MVWYLITQTLFGFLLTWSTNIFLALSFRDFLNTLLVVLPIVSVAGFFWIMIRVQKKPAKKREQRKPLDIISMAFIIFFGVLLLAMVAIVLFFVVSIAVTHITRFFY